MEYSSPLTIYVIWHPDFKDGKRYADLIYQTFNRDTEFALKRNLNIPVFYRTEPNENTGAPISIDYKEAKRNAIVVLVDEELYLSDSWNSYVKNEILAKIQDEPDYRLYPVSLIKTAYQLANGILSKFQFMKVDNIRNENKEVEFSERWRYIRSRLLHDLSRLMYKIDSVGNSIENRHNKGYNALPKPPIKLFISHAKADGLGLAKRIRNYIVEQETQLDTFFDTNQIAESYRFDEQILKEFDENLAVIAILTDAYATREWCRLEISTAKRKKCPLVVVLHIEKGEIRSFPYLGNTPLLKWAENLQDIIDLALVQVLNARFAKESLNEHLKLYSLDTKYQCMIFSSPPEMFNYLDILAEDKKDRKIGLVIYPDPPLGTEELKILEETMPEVKFTTPAHSFQYLP